MKKNIYFYTNLLAWGLVFFLIGNYVFGWTTPSVPPPNDNLPAPINVSSDPQTKSGNLTIGGNLTTGGFKMATGAGADKILTTDASGVASWQTPAGGEDTWITTQTCSTDYALQSVGKTTKTCINKVDYSDVAYDVSCTNCLTNVEVASADYASDADKVDGISSGSFLRSDATDYLTSTIYFRGNLVGGDDGYRDHGVYGNYDSYKTDHIWSMGTSYRNSAAGTNFGNLYGLAYKHTNNTTGGNMAGGHQMVWAQNGTGTSAMGTGLWTSGAITGATINTGYGAKEIGDTVGNCTSTQVHKGDGGCETESSLSVSYATTAGTASQITCTGCVAETEIAQNSLDDSEIQDNSLTAGSLAANSVGNSELIASPTFSTVTLTDLSADNSALGPIGDIQISDGDGKGIKFWNGSTSYAFYMSVADPDRGGVTGYSLTSKMSDTNGRGFRWCNPGECGMSLESYTGQWDLTVANDVTVGTNLSVGGTLTMTSGKITNLATPTVATDAATKAYVDSKPVAPVSPACVLCKSCGGSWPVEGGYFEMWRRTHMDRVKGESCSGTLSSSDTLNISLCCR